MKFNAEAVEKQIVNFIKKTVDDSSTKGVVLGLSGGIDSALSAALCAKAIGTDKVNGVFFYESDENLEENKDYKDALLVAEKIKIEFTTINIKKLLEGLNETYKTIEVKSGNEKKIEKDVYKQNDIYFGNIKARIRMAILYNIANQTNALVCGTKNKSEYMIGYFTKYGDGGTDFEPIADLYKTEVWELSRYMEIPESVISKKPSAEFSAGQTDEDEFGMKYGELDEILKAWERRENKNGKELSDKEKSVIVRIKMGEHKRSMPPICKIK